MVRYRRATAIALVGLLSLVAAPWAQADSPTEQLKTGVETAFQTLKSASRADTERRQAIHDLDGQLFDWTEMGRRLLGGVWEQRSEPERQRFITRLEEIVDAHVLALAPSGIDHIAWGRETASDGRATVRTTVVTNRGEQRQLDFRMILRDAHWKIFDIAIDGMSFIGLYRAQFMQILRTSSFDDLMQKLEQ